jgi:hypothetical protein
MRDIYALREQVEQVALFDDAYLRSLDGHENKSWFIDERTRLIGKRGVAEAKRILHSTGMRASRNRQVLISN